MADADGSISIPFWVRILIKFIPSPWDKLISTIIDIIDKLPAPKQSVVLSAVSLSSENGDHSILTSALHDAVKASSDKIK